MAKEHGPDASGDTALHARVRELERENELLKRKLAEDKLVTRAKFALIQYLKMTEPQAHRYIEKQAMDMRVTRKEIAEGIIKAYESDRL